MIKIKIEDQTQAISKSISRPREEEKKRTKVEEETKKKTREKPSSRLVQGISCLL